MPEYIVEWLRLYAAAYAEMLQHQIGPAFLTWGEITHRLTPEQRIAVWSVYYQRETPDAPPPTPRQQSRWSLCRCNACFYASIRTIAEEGLHA